jgi:dTDP-4-amino-4,6-dideoxygalactose transaminase
VGEEELMELKETLESGWLTTGPKSVQFEESLRNYLGCRNVVSTSSCTAAMHLSLLASGVGRGHEVIVPDLAFMSDASMVEMVGARLILADIDPETLTISIGDLKRRLSPKTKAIVAVHYAGHPCELDELLEIAEERGIVVIQDGAHALASEYKGKKIGEIGKITCFSFHAVKNITGGEGGVVATSDDEIAEKIRRTRLFGIANRRMVELGYKYNMSELHAALCIAQLKKLPFFQQRREQIAKQYFDTFNGSEFVEMPIVRPFVKHSWHLFVVKLKLKNLLCSRDEFKNQLADENIGSQVHFEPIHDQPYFSNRFDPAEYPVTAKMSERILSIPFYPKMSDRDVDDVVAAINRLFKKNNRYS